MAIPDRPQNKDDFVDVDFERVNSSAATKRKKTGKSRRTSKSDNAVNKSDNGDAATIDDQESPFGRFKSLIDISLETGDPEWQKKRVPFFRGEDCIDCKLVFTVDLEGQTYGIAIPFDDAVAIVVQETGISVEGKDSINKKSTTANIMKGDPPVARTYNVDPDSYGDNEEYAELMEIFASKVQEEFGEDFTLRKTPKVLTVSGGLDKIIENWEREMMPKPFAVEELLATTNLLKDEESMDKELESFYSFMREELGDEEFEKTMNEEPTEDDLELMKLFEVPGLRDQQGNLDGLEEVIQSMAKDLKAEEVVEAKRFAPDIENSSLKLFSFEFTNTGKSYALVKPLQPYTLVGKLDVDGEVETDDDGARSEIRFELLTEEEEMIVFPKLAQVCRDDLKASGLKLTGPIDE